VHSLTKIKDYLGHLAAGKKPVVGLEVDVVKDVRHDSHPEVDAEDLARSETSTCGNMRF